MATHSENHYFVPNPAIYPVIIAAGLLSLATGFILSVAREKNLEYLHNPGHWMMVLGAAIIIAMIFKWMGKVVFESESGKYKSWEDKSFRVGMITFIFSRPFLALYFICALSRCPRSLRLTLISPCTKTLFLHGHQAALAGMC
jgi:cytochrome c oxidase subunit III